MLDPEVGRMSNQTAYEWGEAHGSCEAALKWRLSLGNATQRMAWRRCHRGDWLIWQLQHGLSGDELREVIPRLLRAIEAIVERAVRLHCIHCGIGAVERWAERWLSGEDRSAEASEAAAEASDAAAEAAARAARAARDASRAADWAAMDWESELRLQASDIRREILKWEWAI